MLTRIEKKKINNHLEKLNIKKGENLVIFSSLLSFGIYKKYLPKYLLELLLKKISKKGTLIMQSYSFEKKNYIFDLKKLSFNYSSNYLSNIFFKKKEIVRSGCPIHSHIGIGAKAKILLKSNPKNSFGENSDFDNLIKNNFDCIFLGCDANQAGTFMLHLEQIANVKHRKKIEIKKKVFFKKKIKIVKVNYFIKRKNIKYDLNKGFIKLINSGLKVKKVPLKFGKSFRFNLKDFYITGLKLLKKDQKAFLLN